MGRLLIFDTSLESPNLGDRIIMESVNDVVGSLFANSRIARVPTHRFPKRRERYLIRMSRLRLVGGTNLLSSNMNSYRQWRLRDRDVAIASEAVLLGVGWWQYQEPPDAFTTELLNRLLHPRHLHSVRDSYTEEMLGSAGIINVANTGCPTLWGLTATHCSQIPTEKAPAVVATVTDYNMRPEDDAVLLHALNANYREVYVWAQNKKDFNYARELLPTVVPLGPTVDAFDLFLQNHDVDYVGTRLHAGIRAIQRKKRAIVVSIDNRAAEMSKDFGLNTIMRGDLHNLRDMIRSPIVTSIRLPIAAIEKWQEAISVSAS